MRGALARRRYKLTYKLKVNNMVYNPDSQEWEPSSIVYNNLERTLNKLGLGTKLYGSFWDVFPRYRYFKGMNAFKRATAAALRLLNDKKHSDVVYDFDDVVVERMYWRKGKRYYCQYGWTED
jgi:hypothetical protein